MVTIDRLLNELFEKGGSDLHLTAGKPPMIRIDGAILPTEYEKLTPQTVQEVIYSVLTDDHKERFERNKELDLSFGIEGKGRIRMNVFRQRGAVAAVLRNINNRIMTFEELGLPGVTASLANLPKGLILVTGPTGSGKSTTLASMVDYINNSRPGHILTVEDPIEFIHFHKKCIINQREVGTDTDSFGNALKYALREDPDVILIGEMRDLETINAALTIAETGHLVLATLHTTDAIQTLNRIIDVFPSHQQEQVRVQLSFVLQAIFSQQLLLKASGTGRCIAVEVLLLNPAIRNLIREEKIHQVYSTMQTGLSEGMRTMNQALADLYKQGLINFKEAMSHTLDPKELQKLIYNTA